MAFQKLEIESQTTSKKISVRVLYPDILLPAADHSQDKELVKNSSSLATYLSIFFIAFILYSVTASYALEDYDSINFAMAVNNYDLVKDAPHPPGAPVYIASVKLLNSLLNNITLALTLASAFGGALFVTVWYQIFNRLLTAKTAAIGTVILAFSPGLWMTASRPMSDTVAAAVLGVVILLALKYVKSRQPALLIWTAAAMALAVGIRPQFGLLAPLLLFATLFYFRPQTSVMLKSIAVFLLVNLCWLVPTVISQFNLDGDGWMTYFNQIMRFKASFNEASGSPLLANNVQLSEIFYRAVTHIGTLGYFALGLNLWYPESVARILEGFGTTLNPWLRGNVEWTYQGTLYTVVYAFGFLALLPRVSYCWKKAKRISESIGYLLLVIISYSIVVIMLVPPHTRFYIPLLPLFILLPLIGLQSRRWGHRFQYILMASAIFAASPTILDSMMQDAPPIALVKEIQQRSNVTGENTVLLLNSNGSRHARWYLGAAEIYGRNELKAPESPNALFTEGVRVYSNYPNAFPERLVDVELLASYHRPYRVWMRHTSTELFELTLRAIPLAETQETEPGTKLDATVEAIEPVTFEETHQAVIASELEI